MSTAWSKLRWSLAQRGLGGTLRAALRRPQPTPSAQTAPQVHPFDQQYGVDTSGLIPGTDLHSGHRHDVFNTAYYGMAPSRFQQVMARWIADNSHPAIENYSFIDLGCGKGRAVLMASQFKFRQVIGVELHSSLATTAEANVARWTAVGHSTCPVHILCQDAADFRFPPEACLLYLFHPFTAPVLTQVIARIETEFAGRPTQLDVIYFNPEAGELFETNPCFQRLWTGTVEMSQEDAAADWVASAEDLCSIYRWVGQK
ncbi:MAG: class I SAM-dependent methyltransferase [Edaphobacter sp.]